MTTDLTAQEIDELPLVLPGHWTTPEGLEKAKEYLARHRHSLAKSDVPDFALANAIYLISGDSFQLLTFQTAAKERIRWLSVQLAAKDIELATLRTTKPADDAKLALIRWIIKTYGITSNGFQFFQSGAVIPTSGELLAAFTEQQQREKKS